MEIDNTLLLRILACFLPIVAVSLGVGIWIGRSVAQSIETRRIRSERDRTVRTLQAMLQSTDALTQQVDVRNSELRHVEQTVGHLRSVNDLEQVQDQLLQQINNVIVSNRKLEDDLSATRFELQQQAMQLDETRREARTDALSGIANRKGFDEHLTYVMGRWQAKRAPFGLVLADVDHFKRINDSLGHVAGDHVVAGIGELLRKSVRPGGLVARLGGDEFAIILKVEDLETARRACERLKKAVENANLAASDRDAGLSVTLSMGLTVPSSDDTVDSLLRRADQALYQSKKQGRNQLNQLNACPADSSADSSC
ncbi:MAG: GGDEF domain-containing protein [Planctomycetota bacterium]|nr:GGDEF domain-containing protein [Planctomycetota bacterium]MDA1178921.1 GGDEF domain-containing protein [Planctomycetota bacterium]